jgi:hypothetical protein
MLFLEIVQSGKFEKVYLVGNRSNTTHQTGDTRWNPARVVSLISSVGSISNETFFALKILHFVKKLF